MHESCPHKQLVGPSLTNGLEWGHRLHSYTIQLEGTDMPCTNEGSCLSFNHVHVLTTRHCKVVLCTIYTSTLQQLRFYPPACKLRNRPRYIIMHAYIYPPHAP